MVGIYFYAIKLETKSFPTPLVTVDEPFCHIVSCKTSLKLDCIIIEYCYNPPPSIRSHVEAVIYTAVCIPTCLSCASNTCLAI